MKGKKWFIVAVALIILVLGAMGQSLTSRNWQNPLTMDYFNPVSQEIIETGDITRQIAVLEVEGTIMDSGESSAFNPAVTYDHQATLDRIEALKTDDSIKALLLLVESPGGTTYHSVELYRALKELKDARDIPVYVSMGSQAASGGYMISMVGDKIFADSETWTGSIGVILSLVNFNEFMDEYGLDVKVYKSGKNKDMGSSFREPTAEEADIWQDMIDESYNLFVDIVAEGRQMDKGRVRELADGRIYTGPQAVENGLVDEIGYKEDALAKLKAENELEGAQVISITPRPTTSFFSQFTASISNLFNPLQQLPTSEYDILNKVLDNPQQPAQTYYMVGGA